MSHRYIELFLNSTGSSGMSLGGIGNFCGGIFVFLSFEILNHLFSEYN